MRQRDLDHLRDLAQSIRDGFPPSPGVEAHVEEKRTVKPKKRRHVAQRSGRMSKPWQRFIAERRRARKQGRLG